MSCAPGVQDTWVFQSMARTNIPTNAPWASRVGYSRAVRVGNVLEVSGTVAADGQGNVIGKGDYYEQTKFILEKIGAVLKEAGFKWEDVARTRMYVVDITQWEAVGRAHGEVFANIRPATSMVQVASLIEPDYLVEIEVTAVRTGSRD